MQPGNPPSSSVSASILHVCRRALLRPLRDQILRLSGYRVDSTLDVAEALALFHARQYDLVLIDIENQANVTEAEALCAEMKTSRPEQRLSFVCNWRVAIVSDCPDDIVRTEFNPDAFVKGVSDSLI